METRTKTFPVYIFSGRLLYGFIPQQQSCAEIHPIQWELSIKKSKMKTFIQISTVIIIIFFLISLVCAFTIVEA